MCHWLIAKSNDITKNLRINNTKTQDWNIVYLNVFLVKYTPKKTYFSKLLMLRHWCRCGYCYIHARALARKREFKTIHWIIFHSSADIIAKQRQHTNTSSDSEWPIHDCLNFYHNKTVCIIYTDKKNDSSKNGKRRRKKTNWWNEQMMTRRKKAMPNSSGKLWWRTNIHRKKKTIYTAKRRRRRKKKYDNNSKRKHIRIVCAHWMYIFTNIFVESICGSPGKRAKKKQPSRIESTSMI